MPFYAQISSDNKVKQLFFQGDNRAIDGLKKEYPDDLFIETDQFGDADCFKYENGQLIPIERPISDNEIIYKNKSKRNDLLLKSDWTQLPDVALTQAEKTRWSIYRQELRDMTEADFLSGNFPVYK